MVVALAYDGVVFYSRWSANRERGQERARDEAEQARRTVAALGGDELRILSFYASPGVIRPGGHANLCYGVNGAKTVRIEPPVEELRPALSHCLTVAPRKSTEYKLIAQDAAGHTVAQSFILNVAR